MQIMKLCDYLEFNYSNLNVETKFFLPSTT
jgi:hypothetical protein